MNLRGRNKVNPNFNMSSMTDIVFLLLIFFMLTSTLVSPNALNLLLPNSKSKTVEKQTMSISIQDKEASGKEEDFKFYVNGNLTEIKDLESKIVQDLKGSNEPGIILHVSQTVHIEYVVKVMDIAYRNKYKIVLATKP
jgi:biopolymer transport protein ExbD